jgi:membrane-associated protease RseP (regulator of RpoE activity)
MTPRRELVRSSVFFVLTLVSVTLFSMEGVVYGSPLRDSLFAGCLMGILLAHEMGHYVVAKLHGFALSMPLFVPFPLGFGTMGAVIRLRSRPETRQALLEMGVAGPIAGAVVAFAVLAVSLPWTGPDVTPAVGSPLLIFNDPLIVRLLGHVVMDAPPGRYAVLHPAALAGWVGCMLTGINLLPLGQLDGGHVLNAVIPQWARQVSLVGAVVLILAGFAWAGWAVWGVLLLLLGAGRPLPVDDDPPLPLRSRLLAVAALVLFALTFMPVPMEAEVFGG